MNRAELDSKHLSELHALAAEAGVPRYRMMGRGELISKLAEGDSKQTPRQGGGNRGGSGRQRQRDRAPRPREPRREQSSREPRPKPQRGEQAGAAPAAADAGRPKRKRRRRRWGRRRKGVRAHDLLLPPNGGRQAIVYAETREGCTSLLRGLASELSGASRGPDPIAVLVDPSPEELVDWKREAPRAEIVVAGQARHVDDALAQAANRAGGGEDVIVLVDSLTRFAEAYGDADAAQGVFDAGSKVAGGGSGSLTVVAALEPA
jgi:hypothetical protein